MSNIKVFTATILVVFFSTMACKRHYSDVACSNASITIFGLGFPTPDSLADVLKYKQDNAFDSLIDSVRITHFAFDTVYWPALQPITILPGYDYKIVLATGRTFAFSQITNGSHFHENMNTGTGSTCFNPVISYILNDTLVHVTDTTKTHGPLRLYLAE